MFYNEFLFKIVKLGYKNYGDEKSNTINYHSIL